MAQPTVPLDVIRLEDRDNPSTIGVLDTTFNQTGVFVHQFAAGTPTDDQFLAVAAAADGGDVAVGEADGNFLVARFRPDGTLDPAFAGKGYVSIDFDGEFDRANAVAVRPDGSILVAGYATIGGKDEFALAQLGANGTVINTIHQHVGDANKNDRARGLVVSPTTGDVYLIGASAVFGARFADFAVARFDSSLHFIADTKVDVSGMDEGWAGTFDQTGHLVVVGSANNSSAWAVARMNPDLTGVTTRVLSLGGTNDRARVVVAESGTDRLFVAGVTDRNGTYDQAIVRLGGDLSTQAQTILDYDGADDKARAMVLDSQGRLLVGGRAHTDRSNNFGLTRLLPDTLAPDPMFDGSGKTVIDFGGNDQLFGMTLDTSGRPVMVGQSGPNPAIARLMLVDDQSGGLSETPPSSGYLYLRAGVTVGGAGGTAATFTPGADQQYIASGDATPFPGFTGSVRVATADVNGDGAPDTIYGVGPGGGSRVRVVFGSPSNGTAPAPVEFSAFESGFTGGVYVAAADLNRDGKAEVLVTPDEGGGPIVAVYSGAALAAGQTGDAAQTVRFLGIDDQNFRGGARPALGDVNGDGTPDLIVSAGFLGGPRIAIFDGTGLAAGSATPNHLVPDFFAFEPTLRNGAFVTAGDLDGDGKADLAFGGGPNGAPRVRVFDGAKVLAAGSFANADEIAGAAQTANFFAGDPNSRGGVRLAVRDVDGTGKAALITGSGDGEPARVRVYKSATLLGNANPSPDQTLEPFGGAVLPNGVFVG